MGFVIAVEGLDGAGKNTFTQGLCQEIISRGNTCAVHGFPAYDRSPYAQIAQLALQGKIPHLVHSPEAMAMIFAADRYHQKEALDHDIATVDYVICDRYVASNIAYTAARLQISTVEDIAWLADIEFDTLGLPKPNLQIYLETSVELSSLRAQQRAQDAHNGRLDEYEKSQRLQQDVADFYRLLAHNNWLSRWICMTTELPKDIFSTIETYQMKDTQL